MGYSKQMRHPNRAISENPGVQIKLVNDLGKALSHMVC